LQEALRANLEIRGKLTDYLKGLGMPAERIQASKFFPRRPKFGDVGRKKPKSYRVEKPDADFRFRTKRSFRRRPGVVDKWSEVQF